MDVSTAMSLTNVTFSQALEAVKCGYAIQRSGWNGKGLLGKAQIPDAHSKMTTRYLYIEYPDGARCPWHPTHMDMFSNDWKIIIQE